eukprot:5413743-Amphidinium_carterae.2
MLLKARRLWGIETAEASALECLVLNGDAAQANRVIAGAFLERLFVIVNRQAGGGWPHQGPTKRWLLLRQQSST